MVHGWTGRKRDGGREAPGPRGRRTACVGRLIGVEWDSLREPSPLNPSHRSLLGVPLHELPAVLTRHGLASPAQIESFLERHHAGVWIEHDDGLNGRAVSGHEPQIRILRLQQVSDRLQLTCVQALAEFRREALGDGGDVRTTDFDLPESACPRFLGKIDFVPCP